MVEIQERRKEGKRVMEESDGLLFLPREIAIAPLSKRKAERILNSAQEREKHKHAYHRGTCSLTLCTAGQENTDMCGFNLDILCV